MALVTDEGDSSSNSYVTLNEADSYFETGFFDSTWTGLSSDTVRENWLIEAARAIGRYTFKGYRWKGSDQALAFPRVSNYTSTYSLYDRFGEFEEDDEETPVGEIPQKVKDAQCVMAMYLIINQSTTDGTVESKEIQELKVVNGLTEIKYRPEKNQDLIKVGSGATIEAVEALLSPWLKSRHAVPIRR